MDKNCNHEERNHMPTSQKKEETFKDFVDKNKDLIYKIAKSNTAKDESGLTVVTDDDPWRNEEEWEAMYKDQKNK